jgi:steroid delta-isomerase-like uncharacterized protein
VVILTQQCSAGDEHTTAMKGSAMAHETSTVDQNVQGSVIQDHLTLMRRYFDLLHTKNLDSVLGLVDDDIEWLIVPTGDVIRGKAEFAELATNHWSASPDRTKKLLNLFAAEDYACMEYISGGTLTGEVDFGSLAIPPSGRAYQIQCCFVFHFKDHKIDRVHEYFDMDTVKRITGYAAATERRS